MSTRRNSVGDFGGSERKRRSHRDDFSSDDDALPSRKSWKDLARDARASGRVYEVDAPRVDAPRAAPTAVPPAVAPPVAAVASVASASSATEPKAVFSGMLAATVTAFDRSGNVDLGVIPLYAEALKADGVSGVFCNGTTGESMSLSVRERKATTERWMATGLKVCAHIGAQSLADIVELAQHAEAVGVHGVAVMCPFFFKPTTVDDVVAVLAEVSRAAPNTPILAYHFPVLTGVPFKLYDVIQACQARGTVPNLRGAKFTNLDFADFAACQSIKGKITDILYSQEQNIVGAAFLGATAFVGMQFSTIAPLYEKLIAAAQKGDATTAKALQKHVYSYINMVHRVVGTSLEKNVAAAKALVSFRLERDMGPMRPPGVQLTVHEVQRLKDEMVTFVQSYAQAVKPAAAKAAAINIKAMPGFKGELNDHILRRIDEIADRIGVRGLHRMFPHLAVRDGSWRRALPSESVSAARFIDHTILKPEVTKKEVSKLCAEARDNRFYAVCVNGSRVAQCLEELRGTDVRVAAVIGFPLGAGTSRAKAREAHELVKMGAGEIDMVMNVGAFKDGNYALVYEDIKAVVEASRPGIVKVIFETCLLTRDEIIDASILSVAAGAAFVKTSTGFNTGGATPEAIDVMLAVVGNEAQVKASGGVRDAAGAAAYISAGVTRIGTSSGVAIIAGKPAGAGY